MAMFILPVLFVRGMLQGARPTESTPPGVDPKRTIRYATPGIAPNTGIANTIRTNRPENAIYQTGKTNTDDTHWYTPITGVAQEIGNRVQGAAGSAWDSVTAPARWVGNKIDDTAASAWSTIQIVLGVVAGVFSIAAVVMVRNALK